MRETTKKLKARVGRSNYKSKMHKNTLNENQRQALKKLLRYERNAALAECIEIIKENQTPIAIPMIEKLLSDD